MQQLLYYSCRCSSTSYTQDSSAQKMKTVFLFLTVAVATTFAEYSLIELEVHAILHANPSVTEAECTKQCDDAFVLLDPVDETDSDKECADECHCHITNPLCDAPILPVSKSSVLDQSLFALVLSTLIVITMRFM